MNDSTPPWIDGPRTQKEREKEKALARKCLAVQMAKLSGTEPKRSVLLPILLLSIGALLTLAGMR